MIDKLRVVINGMEEIIRSGEENIEEIYLNEEKEVIKIIYNDKNKWDETHIYLKNVQRVDYTLAQEPNDEEDTNLAVASMPSIMNPLNRRR